MRKILMVVGVVLAVGAVGCGHRRVQVANTPEGNACERSGWSWWCWRAVAVHVTDGTGKTASPKLFNDRRIEGFDSASEDFSGFAGDKLSFDFSAVSLGTRNTFDPQSMGTIEAAYPTLEVTYEYDLAAADFGIKFRMTRL